MFEFFSLTYIKGAPFEYFIKYLLGRETIGFGQIHTHINKILQFTSHLHTIYGYIYYPFE